MLWWTAYNWKSILGPPCFFGRGCQSWNLPEPLRLVFGFFFFFFLQRFQLKHLLPQLKLCQWVQGPWHEWYWNLNESPTGGLFTWSHILKPLNRGFFFFFFFFFCYKCIYLVWSQLTQCAGIRWYTVTQHRHAFDLLVNGDSRLCSDCFVPALFLYTHTVNAAWTCICWQCKSAL